MKKTPLRRRSKNPRKLAQTKADHELQEYYRRNYREKCEACGRQFDLMHHHVLKSHSNAGRYNEVNLIFLCKLCHDKLHLGGDLTIVSAYTIKRGKKWEEKIKELRKQKRDSFSIKELQLIAESYRNDKKPSI